MVINRFDATVVMFSMLPTGAKFRPVTGADSRRLYVRDRVHVKVTPSRTALVGEEMQTWPMALSTGVVEVK